MEEKDFVAKYGHDITKRVTVVNPTTEDYIFQHVLQVGVDVATGRMKDEQKTYRVPAGGSERFPGPVADHYLDQMSKILSQNDNKFQYMVDWRLRAEYYDKLIVDVEDLITSYQAFTGPTYLENPPEAPAEEAFATAKTEPVFVGKPAKAKSDGPAA